jgi:hypothetical protein
MSQCRCHSPPFDVSDFSSQLIAVDRGAEICVVTCKLCAARWLHCLFEQEAFAASGCWYRGTLDAPEQAPPSADAALAYLQSLPWYFAGGSYYGSTGFRRSGAIHA